MKIENKIFKINLYIKLGNYIEYLDFSLFAFLSPIILKNLSGLEDNLSGAIYGYLVFASTYLMRPLGGLFFGSISDTKGRLYALTYTILLIGICSIIISFVPSYERIGYASIVIILILRALQCFALGGEFVNSLVILHEINKKSKSSKIGIFLGMGTLGWFSGSSLVSLVSYYKDILIFEEIVWRLPFFLSGFFTIIVFILRKNLVKLIDFQQIDELSSELNSYALIRKSKIFNIFSTMLFAGWNGSLFYGLLIFPATLFSVSSKSSLDEYFSYSQICMSFYAIFLVITGKIFDKYSDVVNIKLITSLICCPTIFIVSLLFINTKYIIFCAILSSLLTAIVMNITALIIPQMFEKKERSRVSSWYYNLGISLLGSTTPFICSVLLDRFSNVYPFLYIGFISFIGSLFLMRIRNV